MFDYEVGANVFREKEFSAEQGSIGKSSAAEKVSTIGGSKGPMLGLVGALVFGMIVL